MRFEVTRGLWAALLISGFAAGDGRSDPVDDATDKITALVGHLGADTFARREEASKALADLGESALPEVRKAAATHKGSGDSRACRGGDPRHHARGRHEQIDGLRLSLIEAGEFRMGSDAALRGEVATNSHATSTSPSPSFWAFTRLLRTSTDAW
ncbi:MAG: hypothetical protein WKF75_21655 [Singulisphaera sp.]